jgi:hypothetical protein
MGDGSVIKEIGLYIKSFLLSVLQDKRKLNTGVEFRPIFCSPKTIVSESGTFY